MFVIDEDLFERIRTEYLGAGFNYLTNKYGEENRKALQEVLSAHDFEELEEETTRISTATAQTA